LVTLSKVIQKYKGNWCLATQETLLLLLKEYHGIKINRRMLNYHLADLRNHNLINTIKRTRRNEDGTLCLLSSSTCLTVKGCYVLARNGFAWAYKHAKKLRKKYFPFISSKNIQEKGEVTNKDSTVQLKYNPFNDPEFRKVTGIDKIVFDTS